MRRKLSQKEKEEKEKEKNRIIRHELIVKRAAEKESRRMNKLKQKKINKILRIANIIGEELWKNACQKAKKYCSERKYASKHFYGLTSDISNCKSYKVKDIKIPKKCFDKKNMCENICK